jgi:hypothetical protein
MNYGKMITSICVFSVVMGITFSAHAMKRKSDVEVQLYSEKHPRIIKNARELYYQKLYQFQFPSPAFNEYYKTGNFAPIQAILDNARLDVERVNQNNNNNNNNNKS